MRWSAHSSTSSTPGSRRACLNRRPAGAGSTMGRMGPGRRLALVGASYALGTFPAADLVARALGRDVHAEGSGNPGASNVYRLAGGKAAALVLLADAAKGALPAWVGLRAERAER